MKIQVIEVFIDKFTEEVYDIGTILDVNDEDRVADLVERGLVKTEVTKTRRKGKCLTK